MRLKTQRRAIYAAMGLTVISLVGGFALASVQLGQTNTTSQGSQTTTITSVPGLGWTSTSLVMLGASVTNSSCGNPVSPCDVSTASVVDCAGGFAGFTGCVAGQWVEQVVLTTTAGTPFGSSINITLYVSNGATITTGIVYDYTDGAGNTAQTIVLDFGIGNMASGPHLVSVLSTVINGY